MNQYMFNQIEKVGATARNKFIQSSAIHLSNKYVLSGCHVSGTALGTGDTFKFYVSGLASRNGAHRLTFCLEPFWLFSYVY